MGDAQRVLIVGATGITGYSACVAFREAGWHVFGLARNPEKLPSGVTPVQADVRDAAGLAKALADINPTHVVFATWSRQSTEAENIRVNVAMLAAVLDALESAPLEHVSLVTGLKHYMGPFEAYAKSPAATPFHESQERLSYPNFYYDQEDLLFARAVSQGFTWTVHRASTIIGWAIGNAMNMGVTLAVYGAICKASDRPFVFPGSPQQWSGIVDVVDARQLAAQILWAAHAPKARDEAFNITNGDVFRWREMWGHVAHDLDVPAAPYPGAAQPLEQQMVDAEPIWNFVVEDANLVPHSLSDLVSWWHTDADLGRPIEAFADNSKSRDAGFLTYQTTRRSFHDLFAQLRAARIIPERNWRPSRIV